MPLSLFKATHICDLNRFFKDVRSPYSHFSSSDTLFDIKNENTFGYPTFFLDDTLQSDKKTHEWNSRIRACDCEGKLPFRAVSASLVMVTSTGIVNIQRHFIFIDNFTAIS